MRKLILFYMLTVLQFVAGTLVFMFWHWGIYGQYAWSDWGQVVWHSLSQDYTVAGYIVALPLVLKLVHIWCPGSWFRKSLYWILGVLLTVAMLLWFVDLQLFGYWGFRLDSTPMIYLLDNPMEALASVPIGAFLLGTALFAVSVWCAIRSLHMLWPAKGEESMRRRVMKTVGGIVLAGLCFVAIRGGVTESTMNIGRAYFSSEMQLNQASVNPVFSFLYSMGKRKDYNKMYRFMSDEECSAAMAALERETVAPQPEIERLELLNTHRPNILIVILEGFSGPACTALYPDADPRVMPELSRLYQEGIGWTRFYASSWRTDRGVASLLASYPAQPTTTVMKDQSKCNNLQYLPKRLKEEGYDLQFIYGGDANFTNMLGFLRAGGIDKVMSMEDFSIEERQQEWGAPDALVYDRLYEQIKADRGASQPFCKIMLTLSSHEPYDVPDFSRLEHPFANSYAYADSCLGAFVDRLRADADLWRNLLVVLVPDHCSNYPDLELQDPIRYHIPMVWLGGALSQEVLADGQPASPRLIDRLGGQVDLSATLLGQLGIAHDDFNFSKDLLDSRSPKYAFFDFPDGLGIIADVAEDGAVSTYTYVQDNQQCDVALKGSFDPDGKACLWGKAYLQHLMDDMAQR